MHRWILLYIQSSLKMVPPNMYDPTISQQPFGAAANMLEKN
jgi:hypothetical protein